MKTHNLLLYIPASIANSINTCAHNYHDASLCNYKSDDVSIKSVKSNPANNIRSGNMAFTIGLQANGAEVLDKFSLSSKN